MEIKRGGVYYANLGNNDNSVQGGIRPVLVIQNDKGNQTSPTTVIIPFTKKSNNKQWLPSHFIYKKDELLKSDSILLCEQIRVINKNSLLKLIGVIDDWLLFKITMTLLDSLEINNIGSENKYDI